MTLTTAEKKQFRAIGHRLKPIVTVSENGLSEPVLLEVNRALNDHELIKVKVKAADREYKAELVKQLCENCHAELVQLTGHVALLLRRHPKPNPKLSNLIRPI